MEIESSQDWITIHIRDKKGGRGIGFSIELLPQLIQELSEIRSKHGTDSDRTEQTTADND